MAHPQVKEVEQTCRFVCGVHVAGTDFDASCSRYSGTTTADPFSKAVMNCFTAVIEISNLDISCSPMRDANCCNASLLFLYF